MTRAIFTYLVALLVIFAFLPWINSYSTSTQFLICAPIILLLGIPHGAIDHIFYRRNHNYSYWGFIKAYLVLITLNVALWIISAPVAYAIFIALSAYHFGQSQFSHFLQQKHWQTHLLALSWGMAVLTGLIFFNQYEIQALLINSSDFKQLAILHGPVLISTLFYGFTIITLLLIILLRKQQMLGNEDMFMEVLILFLILVSFFLLPLMPGFTLYFVLLHALKVLREEFHVLNIEGEVKSLTHFTKMLAPFTIFSLAGIGVLFLLTWLALIPFNPGYLLLVVISSITLPHAVVMNDFYFTLFNAKKLRRYL